MQPNPSVNSIPRPFNNFLAAYESYYAGTGLPRAFIIWSGIWLVSSCLQDNVYVADRRSHTRPNMYIWFISPAGTGKSESAKPAIELLKMLPFIDVYDGQLTQVHLFKHLTSQQARRNMFNPTATNPRLAIFSDELAATLGSGPMAEELMKALTVMYSGSYKYGTGRHGLLTIDNPVLTWLACCSPPWLRRSVPRDMLDSGFIARVISIYEPLRQRRRSGVDNDPTLQTSLLRDMARMCVLAGEMELSPEAASLRDQWAEKQFAARLSMDEVIRDIYGREEEHTLKVAMCLTASAGNDLVISRRAFANAANLVLDARRNSIDVLLSIAASAQGQLKSYLLSIIQQQGRILQSDLRGRTHRRIDDNITFNRLIDALVEEGSIVKIPSDNGRGVVFEITNGNAQP